MVNGWQIVPFAEVLTPISKPEPIEQDKIYRILGMRWYALGLFIRQDKPGHLIQAKELFRVEKDDFVYNRLFAWKGSFGIVDSSTAGGYVSGEFPCFHVVTKKADPKFLHFYLSQEPIWNEIGRISSGQTNISRLRLKVPDFLRMKIPLPPLDEQRRIVAYIEALAAPVSEALRLRRETKEEAEKFILSARNKIFAELTSSEVFLESLVFHAHNGFGRRPKFGESGPVVLRLADVSSGQVDLSNPRRVEMTDEEYEQYKVEQGDLIFVRVNGSLSIVGKCILCKFDGNDKVAYNDHLIRAKINPEKLDPEYATLWLNSTEIRKLIESRAITTAGQYSISQTSLLTLPIKLPLLNEQQQIVAYLNGLQAQVDAIHRKQAETQKELEALLPTILDKAFKGEL
jgi:type I restriction enzyme S subunit